MASNRFQGVRRACRLEPAAAWEPRRNHPVQVEGSYHRPGEWTHHAAATLSTATARSCTSSWKLRVAAERSALITTSHPLAGTTRRAALRSRRRARFRVTALRGLSAITSPTRVGPWRSWKYRVSLSRRIRRPLRSTRRNARPPLSDSFRHIATGLKPTAGHDPWPVCS